jgi:hypothetical protein
MLILFITIPALNEGTVGIMVPVSALFTIGVSFLLYKKGLLTKKQPEDNNLDALANSDSESEDL